VGGGAGEKGWEKDRWGGSRREQGGERMRAEKRDEREGGGRSGLVAC